jgi:tRNA(Ile2) C34 agmatinyltransferase TiaS
MLTTKAPPAALARSDETRCECGQLIAKVRGQGIELKCKRCKRIVMIPFSTIEGWSSIAS